MAHIFISYAKKDTRELALSLADALNNLDSVTAWVDRSLRAGRSWELQIQAEIDRCDTMIVLYSPDINRHQSGKKESYVLTEIAYAKYTVNKPIIPIMAQETVPPISLTTAHYIDFTLNGLTLDDLVDAICHEMDVDILKTETNIIVNESINDAIERARQFRGKHNRDWQPYITTFSDSPIPEMPFCLVPVGRFDMGSDDGYYFDEQPVYLQTISEPYWLAQYPVTNAQWRLGMDAGVVKEPSGDSALKWYKDSLMAHTPVVGIDWFMARDFAQWLGCRLPSELEWEYGARGVESWRYPWGDDWKPDLPIWGENSGGKPALITSKAEGKSWIGAYHLSGNVWEWTNSLFKDYPYQPDDGREVDIGNETDVLRVLRGGSWGNDGTDYLRSACRSNYYPDDGDFFRGFRLFRSLNSSND